MAKTTNFIREYLETLPDEALIAICRRAGIPESEIPKPRKPDPFECEVWPRKRDRRTTDGT
jgi:hypothetical protein